MVPFYTFYSMFGFQRVGDLIWQAADARTKGFLLGATAGRTTLLGEGLQHQDGQSLLLASAVPAVQAYDPAFAYEIAAIIKDGLNRMYGPANEDVFYYLTLYNENYPMPPSPTREGIVAEIVRGLYLWQDAPAANVKATLLFSGSAHAAVREAATELLAHYGVGCELWSATSYKTLREDGLAVERWTTASAASCGRRRRTRRCAKTASPWSVGTACIPTPISARPWWPNCSRARPVRSSPRPTS
jgi:pyruvate dehydrogenase E1 component